MVERRLHHPSMLHMDRLFVGKKSFTKNLSHSCETDSFDEVVLFSDGDFITSLSGEDADEEFAR